VSEIWYRFNTMGDINLFQNKECIDGIIIPANLIAFYDPSLSNFMIDINLPFLIDPMTYIWERSKINIVNDKGELKKSYQMYIIKLSCNIAKFLDNDNLSLIDSNVDDLSEFVNNILLFQKNLGSLKKETRYRKLSLDRIRSRIKKDINKNVTPVSLIPPYFYFNNIYEDTYNLTKKSIEIAQKNKLSNNFSISPCICFNKDLLYQDDQIEVLLNDFKSFNNVLIWVNEFDDRIDSVFELLAFRKFINNFSKENVNTINLYGSYYSILLNYYGLNKFSSGIAVSHKKSVDSSSSGGGLPLRYYEPNFKIELLSEDVFSLYAEYPELFTCECPICMEYSKKIKEFDLKEEREQYLDEIFLEEREFIDGKSKLVRPAKIDWFNTRCHSIYVRKMEMTSQQNNPIENTKNDLLESYQRLNKIINYDDFSRISKPEHLMRWYSSI